MSQKIVSGNYNNNNRKSAEKWLLRDAKLPPIAAEPCAAVIATGVVFCSSTQYEEGFGCRIVAFCETAVSSESLEVQDMTGGKRLHFRFDGFYDEDENMVESCGRLILNTDGSMFAFD
jgi:hypothetical protein